MAHERRNLRILGPFGSWNELESESAGSVVKRPRGEGFGGEELLGGTSNWGGTMALGNTELAASIIESVISPDEV
jgi:hypothetical protein